MRLLPMLLLICCFLALAAQAPAQDPLRQAEADYRQAKARAAALERRAARLGDRMEQLRGEQQAAVAQIDAAEARITLADLELREAQARAAAIGRRLVDARRPASMLLAGLATLARRPPLLAIADTRDIDALVRTKLLIDTTMPVIRSRAAALERQANAAGDAVADARQAGARRNASRAALDARQAALAKLERRVENEAQRTGEAALGAGDNALRAAESMDVIRRNRSADRGIMDVARELAALEAFPERPTVSEAVIEGPTGYRLPALAPVSAGLGMIDDGGVRARGLTMDTARGAQVAAPAAGRILFSGPFHDLDGILIIDHGGGWRSVLTNVGSQLPKGKSVAAGAPIGRALGPIGIELSRSGKYYSPALIAGSSGPLSNAPINR